MDPVLLTSSGGVAWLRFNRPERLNALGPDMTSAFLTAVETVVGDPANRVLVMTGMGRAFVAGGDLAWLREAHDRSAAAHGLITPMHDGLKRLRHSGVLTVAGVNGVAAGAGMSLALLADFTIASEAAVFGMAYIGVGGSPDCGGSWGLARAVGRRKALELALLGERLTAADALDLGLVNRVVSAEALERECQALAERLAALPWGAAMATRDLIDAGAGSSLEAQLDRERACFMRAASADDFAEAMDAFFNRRPARFGGDRTGPVHPRHPHGS